MKRKLKTLTEQFTDARTNYNRILGRGDKSLMTEQSTGMYHRWQGIYGSNCSLSGIQNFHTTNGCLMDPACNTPQQNHDAWVIMGSPNPGEFVNGWTSTGNPKCWKYLGTSPNPQTNQYGAAPYNSWNGLTFHVVSNCSDCFNPPTPPPTPCTTYGCTDPTATNYNSTILPNCDDNSCVWLGCTDSTASNYDPTATVDDGTCITSSCDTSTSSPCAVQWFQNPNANWASTWITNRDCSNYNWPSINLEQQAISIMAGAPTPQTGPYNNWNDIWSAGQNSGLTPANAFIAKMAKAKYSACQIQACNC